MKKFIFAIRDNKTSFMDPFVDVSEESAKRGFFFALSNRPDSIMSYSPADFDLFLVGSFDTESGLISPYKVAEFIANGVDAFRSNEYEK